MNLAESEDMTPWTVTAWLDLVEEGKRDTAGKLHVSVEWIPEIQLPPDLMKGTVVARCREVRGLLNVDTFGKNDVYALVRTVGAADLR